jgi:hypothetical protein
VSDEHREETQENEREETVKDLDVSEEESEDVRGGAARQGIRPTR